MLHPSMMFNPFEVEKDPRARYLFAVLNSFVATPEEQEEWREMMREKVIARHNEAEEWKTDPDGMRHKTNISQYEKSAMDSRKRLDGLDRANRFEIRASYVRQNDPHKKFDGWNEFGDHYLMNGFMEEGGHWR